MPMITEQSPIVFKDRLPPSVDVAVIGAGVIGISTAWFLREAGASVLVCEKGRVACEQSSRNWGWIRQQGRDAAEVPIAMDSVNLWEQLARELDTNIGFARRGVLYTARTERELAHFESWLAIADRHQLDTRILSGPEVDALLDGYPGRWQGGMFTPSDARAEPFKAVPALARALRSRGAAIRESCAVRTLDMEAGRVSGIVTEHGRVRASSVVCAAGAWSTRFLGNLGVDLPQLTARATVARTAPTPSFYEGAATLGEVAIRRRADGGYTVAAGSMNEHLLSGDSFRFFRKFMPAYQASKRWLHLRFDGDLFNRLFPTRRWKEDEITPFEDVRVLNPEPSRAALQKIREGLAERAPRLAELPFEEAWAGMIDVMPDVVPVIDRVPTHSGLYVATGFSGHGFGIGPGAGRVVADMVLGKSPRHDLTRFRFDRFTDGSPLDVGPGL